jgi:hypothetical protein
VPKVKKLYDYFGLPITATMDDLRKAYRSMSKKLHPDVNKSSVAHEEFTHLQSTYNALSDHLQKGRRATQNRHYEPTRKQRKEKSTSTEPPKTSKKPIYTKEQLERLRLATQYLDDSDFRNEYNNEHAQTQQRIRKMKMLQYGIMAAILISMFFLQKDHRFISIIVLYLIAYFMAHLIDNMRKKHKGHDQLKKDVAELLRRRRRKNAN